MDINHLRINHLQINHQTIINDLVLQMYQLYRFWPNSTPSMHVERAAHAFRLSRSPPIMSHIVTDRGISNKR